MIRLPEAFQERMERQLGEEYEAFAASYEQERSQGLRWNPLKAEGAEVLERAGFHLTPIPWAEEGYYYEAEDRPGKHPFHEAGLYYIQEPSAMAAAELLEPKPGERILDLCAAPGGKTTHIAGKLKGQGILISNEIIPSRARVLSQNVERMGVGNAVVLNEDPTVLAERFPEFFDGIVVDAPCSGEGMFRKDEEALRQWSPDHVTMCAARQAQILDNGARMVRPGGRLVYSTCTFAPEENEAVILDFLNRHREFHIRKPDRLPNGFSTGRPEWTGEPGNLRGACLKDTIRIWPHKVRGEGHYLALLERDGERAEGTKEPEGRRKPAKKRKQGKSVISREQWKLVEDFCGQVLSETGAEWLLGQRRESFLLFGDQLYLLPSSFWDAAGEAGLSGLRVMRPGLHVGTFKKDRLEPSHSLALFLKPDQAKRSYSISLSGEDGVKEAKAYLTGIELRPAGGVLDGSDRSRGNGRAASGWVLVCVEGYSLGWAKGSGQVLKNHYPKGLRWLPG